MIAKLLFLLISSSLILSLRAQVPLHVLPGTAPLERFGSSMVEVGDLNGDLAPELAIGTGNGRVDVTDGSSGRLAFSLTGLPNEDFGYALASMGDIDGDQVPDIAVGAPSFSNPAGAGRVIFFSGATGIPFATLLGGTAGDRFGFSLLAVDLTGDRLLDLVVGSPGRDLPVTDAGEVSLFDGQTQLLLLSARGNQLAENFGFSLAWIKDVNGDFVRDVIVGAPGGNQPPMTTFFGGTGEVQLLSGSSFATLLLLQGVEAESLFGSAVASCSDVDDDGLDDIVVGAPGMDEGPGVDCGLVSIFGSTQGRELAGFVGVESGERFGAVLCNLGDIDQSGTTDLAVGSPSWGEVVSGRVEVIDVPLNRTIFEFHGSGVFENVGKSVAASRGFGADKYGEFYFGASGASPNGIFSGQVRSFSFGRGLYGVLPRGNVGASGGANPAPLLRINGQGGGWKRHHVRVSLGSPFAVSLVQPPNRVTPAPFVIYGMLGIPLATSGFDVPGNVGRMMVLPCDAAPSLQPNLFTFADAAGSSLCPSLVQATPTPWSVLLPGINFPLSWTLQGLVEIAPGVVEVTNAVLLTID